MYENEVFHDFVYAFHMPLFFVAAGWLYKEKPVLQYTKHRFFTVMIPYFSFGLITLVYWQLIERRFRSSDMTFLQSLIGLFRGEYDYLDFNVHLWFLPCFFMTVVIYNLMKKVAGKKWTYITVGILSAVYIMGIYTSWGLPSLVWGLDRVCQYIGFYAIGNAMAEGKVNERIKQKLPWVVIATVLLSFVLVLSLRDLTTGVFWFVTGTIGTMAIAVYSLLLGRCKIMAYLGRISLIVLCTHGPVYRVIAKVMSVILRIDTDAARANFAISLIIVVLTLFVCSVGYSMINRWLPWMIGKKLREET